MRRKSPWRRIGWALVIAFLTYVAIGIILAGHDVPLVPPATNLVRLRGGRVDAHHITTHSWSFDYDSAVFSPDDTSGSLEGIRHGIVYRKGKPYLAISAEHVSVNLQSLDFSAIGKVHVERIHSPQNYSFDTDLVVWTNNAKLLRLDHPSYLHSGNGETMRMEGVTINFTDDSIHFDKIHGAIEIRK